MSFKKVSPKSKNAAATPADPAIPGAIPTELLNSVESEVSKESAPLLEFLVRHARKIGLAIVVLVVVLAGYGGYRWWEARNHAAGMKDLGRVLVAGASPEQLRKVLAFAEQGPSSTRIAAYFEAARIATELGDKTMAAAAWGKVAQAGGAMGFAAQMSQAQLLLTAGDPEGAARLYQSIKTASNPDVEKALLAYSAMAWSQAADKSDTARAEAVKAYEKLITMAGPREKPLFEYCLARVQTVQ